jgi:hypothetical protein
MSLRAIVILGLPLLALSLRSDIVLAGDKPPDTMRIKATYRVYFVGLPFGDVRLRMALKGSEYEMKGDGRFSILAGLISRWQGRTASSGKIAKSAPKPSKYKLKYSGGDKRGDVRIIFSDGAATEVSISPKKRPNPRDIPVTKEELKGVLDPMTGAFLRPRPDIRDADLKVCNETIPVFDGERRFNLVLTPKERVRVEIDAPTDYSGFAAVCQVQFVPIAGYRPDNGAINYLSHTDAIEVALMPLPATALYVPYRISVPTVVGSGSAILTSFQIEKSQADDAKGN